MSKILINIVIYFLYYSFIIYNYILYMYRSRACARANYFQKNKEKELDPKLAIEFIKFVTGLATTNL